MKYALYSNNIRLLEFPDEVTCVFEANVYVFKFLLGLEGWESISRCKIDDTKKFLQFVNDFIGGSLGYEIKQVPREFSVLLSDGFRYTYKAYDGSVPVVGRLVNGSEIVFFQEL